MDMATQQEFIKSVARKFSPPRKKETWGILIQEDFDWDAHVAKVTNQTNRILEMIRRIYEDKSFQNIVQI